MGGIPEIAAAMLSMSERRLEAVSHNVANTGTAGFKSQSMFQDALAAASAEVSDIFQAPSAMSSEAEVTSALQKMARMAQGKLSQTNNPLDLAISGDGFFAVRSDDIMSYTRAGQFQLDGDGYLVDAENRRLQSADGGDIRLSEAAPEILSDGTLLEGGLPAGRIGVFQSEKAGDLTSLGGTEFRAFAGELAQTETAMVRQGMLEASNVELSAEMVNMMSALREAEMGAQLIRTYDTLLGQAISTFGQGG